MPTYDPDEMAARGRVGGHAVHAKYGKVVSSTAQRGFLDKFLRDVDPDGVLSEDERQFRAEQALKAHMARMALRSAEARRNKSLSVQHRSRISASRSKGARGDA